MGQGFKEVAALRTNEKEFEKNFDKIDWGSGAKDTLKENKSTEASTPTSESDIFDEIQCKDIEKDEYCEVDIYGHKCNIHIEDLANLFIKAGIVSLPEGEKPYSKMFDSLIAQKMVSFWFSLFEGHYFMTVTNSRISNVLQGYAIAKGMM